MENFHIRTHRIPASHLREFPRATAHSEEDTLLLSVKQYIPHDNPFPHPGDLTILAAHACGFNKELYEPLWDHLHAQAKAKGVKIRGIWIADSAWHAESAALNEDVLGDDPHWFDHSRDLAQLVNVFHAEMPRPIIGVGHSMGGCQLARLAIWHPSLFTSLILIDPVILPFSAEMIPGKEKTNAARASTFRRDVWGSRKEAKAAFLKSEFYRAWDPEVLERWLEFGLRDCPTAKYPDLKNGEVTLSTPIEQEVWSFLRPNYTNQDENKRVTHPDLNAKYPNQSPFYRAEPIWMFERIEELRPSVYYIFGDKSFVTSKKWNDDRVARTGRGVGGSGGRVGEVTFEGIGHMIAMEIPERTAEAMAGWIEGEMGIWRERRKTLEEQWWSRPMNEKQSLDERWIQGMGGRPVRKHTTPQKL